MQHLLPHYSFYISSYLIMFSCCHFCRLVRAPFSTMNLFCFSLRLISKLIYNQIKVDHHTTRGFKSLESLECSLLAGGGVSRIYGTWCALIVQYLRYDILRAVGEGREGRGERGERGERREKSKSDGPILIHYTGERTILENS